MSEMEHATATDLERLYRSRFLAFASTVNALLGDAEEARDVVQDAFATALDRGREYAGTGTLEAWVWRIVVNRALDRLRARSRAAKRPPLLEPQSANGSYEAAAAVRAHLLALPPRQRLAVFLRYYADLDYDTISRVLEISPGTVAAALSHARGTLRARLTEEETHER